VISEVGQIEYRRRELSLRQVDLAKRIGVSTMTISRIERGVTSLSSLPLDRLDAIAAALEWSRETLLSTIER
jgi:transcriptional regulator with XRE-family HTH domain